MTGAEPRFRDQPLHGDRSGPDGTISRGLIDTEGVRRCHSSRRRCAMACAWSWVTHASVNRNSHGEYGDESATLGGTTVASSMIVCRSW